MKANKIIAAILILIGIALLALGITLGLKSRNKQPADGASENPHVPPDQRVYAVAEVVKYIPDNIGSLTRDQKSAWAKDLPDAYIKELCAMAYRIEQSRSYPTGLPPRALTKDDLKILQARPAASAEKGRRDFTVK